MLATRMYAIPISATTYTTAAGDHDLWEIAPATNKPIAIHAVYIANITEVGDAQEENIRITVLRGNSGTGLGGTTVTPAVIRPNDGAAGFTAKVMNTTTATTASQAVLHEDAWNVRIPLQIIWTPETRPYASAADNRIIVRSGTTAADNLDISGTLYVEELI